MVTIIPFKALRPGAQYAKLVASKPYDVLTSAEAKIEAQGNPTSFLHITKSEIDLSENMDPHSQKVYDKAKQNLDAFISRNILFTENKPCYYIYQLTMNDICQTGLVCCSSVDDYENDLIKKHEFTTPDKELDRINHIKTTGAHTGNVFLAYKSLPVIDELMHNCKKERSPVYDFMADDNVRHTIWIVNDEKNIQNISDAFKSHVPATYIADGHHRAASAAKVRIHLGGNSTAANYFLTTLFPSNQLKIMAYNRVIKDLNGLTEDEFLQKVNEKFSVEKTGEAFSPTRPHTFGMYINKQWYVLSINRIDAPEDPVGALDISILQDNLLQPVLGIADQRTDKRIDFIGGIRGSEELEKRVDSDEMAVAFSLHPVSINKLFDVADTGNIMPPKSTWFEPKLRDGLLTHLIN
ncbi:MAG: DUF1015 domain-containing protein [Chitinophagaceae bacterium]|nr:DUF1015 domain-containing protein [Chitinophagaceae bacterium]